MWPLSLFVSRLTTVLVLARQKNQQFTSLLLLTVSESVTKPTNQPTKPNQITIMAAPYPPQGGAANGPPPEGPAAMPDSYFTESRKGEVNELKNLLRNFNTERDPKRRRDIIKKVIAYMTLGIDVSRLFSEMMMAIETRDLVIKKMVYLYLVNYAKSHPELAQMCTNTLQKDCGNEDPMVRGLALRALCGLQLPEMVEYISEPLRRSLTDGHAYVRKTGVMGILKLYRLNPAAFEESSFVDILYDMLRDPDSSVVANCIIVLNEVMAHSPNGGMAINRAIMLHLLNRIHEFSEFSVVQVLDLVPRYIPANDEEAFQIMNLLDPVLGRYSPGAVIATIRAFWSMAEAVGGQETEAMKRQIVSRCKAPLVTLISSCSSELGYSLLKHADALIEACPGVFDDEYRQFYIKYNEPTHIKYLKISILPKLANPDNAPDIVAELAECVNDINVKLSRYAVRSMTRVACRDTGGPGCAESIARRLVEMLDLNVAHICSEAATALTSVLRKHPSLKEVAAPPLSRCLKYIEETSGKTSIVYLLGECGDIVNEAPYALEKLIDSYDELTDPTVKIALLSSTMKLFFLRPPEVQQMLGRLLAKATDDVSSQDLHDRALLYYRMLKSGVDPTVMQTVINTKTVIASGIKFAEEDDFELRKELMTEFNTLSIVFGKVSQDFIQDEFQVKFVKQPKEHPLSPSEAAAAPIPEANGHAGGEVDLMGGGGPPVAAAAPPAPAPAGDLVDFLGFGDPSPAAAPAPHAHAPPFSPSASLSGDDYQNSWGAINDSVSIVTMIPMKGIPGSTDEVEAALATNNIMTMASGELPTEFKFFLYARETSSNALILIQGNIDKQSGEALLLLTCKVSGGDGLNDQKKIDILTAVMTQSLA